MAAANALPLQQGIYGLSSPSHAFAITPDDTNQLAQTIRAIYVGVAGDVEAVMADDSVAVLLKALPVGVHYLAIKQVKQTNTTATNLLGMY